MIKKLSSRFALGLLAACSSFSALAQPWTITTTYTTNPVTTAIVFNAVASPSMFATFTVKNNNTYPVKITEVGNLHVYTKQNGATYTLWSAPDPLSNAPTPPDQNADGTAPDVRVSTGWTQCGSSISPINGTANAVISVITNTFGFIAPGETRRFALAVDDSFYVATGGAFPNNTLPTPTTYTVSNITLNTGATWTGSLPNNALVNGSISIPFVWDGYLVLDKAEPRKPKISVTPNLVCKGECVVITAQADTYIHSPVYTFYDQNGNVLLPGPTDPPNQRTKCNMQPSDAGNYTVTVTDGTLTSAPAGVKIGVVDPKPPMIDGQVDFCLNDPFTPVTVIGSAPFNYYYTQTGGSPLPFVPYFNTTTANEADFWVSQTVNGCPSPRTNIHYRAAPKPNAPIVTTPIYYCENSTASQLSANGQKPLKWYYQPTGGIPSQVAPTPNTTKLDSFQYYVTQTVDGCESDRSRIDVVVARKPNGLILPSRTEICQGDTVMLGYYGSAFPTSGYNWEYPADAVPMSKDSNTVIVAFDSAGKHSIKLSVGIETCHSPEYIQEIQVDAKPVAIIESGDRICENQRVQISLSYYTPTIDSFFWDFDGGVVSNASTDQGPYGVTWSTPGKKNIQLRIVDGLCNVTYVDTPNVHPKPDATFTLDKKTGPYCYDDSLLFTANTIASVSTYSWTPARFFDIYNNLPTAYGHLDYQDTASIKLTVTDQYGCMNTEAQVLQTKPCCEVLFPTAFSPNHDGKNDYFHPIIMGHQEIRTLKVMNRWGQTVYEAVNIGQGWDGTMNGKELEMGTYYYFLSYKCAGKSMEQKGEIVLVH